MGCTKIELYNNYYLELFVTDSTGEPVTGLSTSYTIYKSSDNSVVNSGALTEIGGGIYRVLKNFDVLGQFYVIYNTPSDYTDEIENIIVHEEIAKASVVARILGLSQENLRIVNPIYDGQNNLLSATTKIYNNASDCNNDTNSLATYSLEATYDTNNNVVTYKMIKD